MSLYRTRNRLLLAGVEAQSGVEEALAPATNAILVENPQPSPDFEVLETNEVGSALDGRGPIVGGGNYGLTFDAYLKGPGSPGQAPEAGVLLRGCALAETLSAADVTGTAQTGAAGTITLAAGASALDEAYRGLVIAIGGGTGSGQVRVVASYAGATRVASVYPAWATPPDATSTYTLYAGALYRPASVDLETLTLWLYDHAASSATQSLLRKIVGAAGSFTLSLTTRQTGKLSFTFQGILPALPSNVAAPPAPSYDASRPPPFIEADAWLGGAAVKFREFSFDIGNTVQQADDPGAAYGYDIAGVTSRRVTGQINPNLTLLSTRNNLADFLAGMPRALWLRYGSTPGNRLSLYLPELRYTGAEPSDTDGYTAETLAYEAAGFDQGCFLCFY